jgi:soluble lytic murein transglycosylase-like protein
MPSPRSFDEQIFAYSRINGLDPYFVSALIKTESSFNPRAVSHAGAVGLMQIMPKTAEMVAGYTVTPEMLKDAHFNLAVGTRHLRDLAVRFRNPLAVCSAWNAGAGAVEKYGIVPPYTETINFGANVLSRWESFKKNGKFD